MTPDEQLARWVAGESIHRGGKTDGECCPDFSCCQPSLLQPEEVRRAFAAADDRERGRFLLTFLGAMVADLGASERVYVAGKPPGEEA